MHTGLDYATQRYSPLTQITQRNVAHLAPRSLLQLELPQAGAGAEATPIVADGRLYVTSDYGVVTAFDLAANRRLWRYVPRLGVAKPCCGPVNRGVALGLGNVFVGTLDSRLVALDADSGTLRWEVVNSDADSAYSITMAPLVVGNRAIVGTSGGEFATRGNVTAYDARNGNRPGRWYAIPSPGRRQPLHGVRRRPRRRDRRAEVALSSGSARRMGLRPREPTGHRAGREPQGPPGCRQDGLGVCPRRRHRGAHPAVRIVRAAAEPVRCTDARRGGDCARTGGRRELATLGVLPWDGPSLCARAASRVYADPGRRRSAERRVLDRRRSAARRGRSDVRNDYGHPAVERQDRLAATNRTSVERRTRHGGRARVCRTERRLVPCVCRVQGAAGVGVFLLRGC